jgi:hypothetical protein
MFAGLGYKFKKELSINCFDFRMHYREGMDLFVPETVDWIGRGGFVHDKSDGAERKDEG